MDSPFRALGLGPVAVAPDQQRKGIGGSLIRSSLEVAEKEGWQSVFVLGDPVLYQKFGFDPALANGFTSPYAGPHLMALSFKRPFPFTTGKIEYAPAFAMLGYAKPHSA